MTHSTRELFSMESYWEVEVYLRSFELDQRLLELYGLSFCSNMFWRNVKEGRTNQCDITVPYSYVMRVWVMSWEDNSGLKFWVYLKGDTDFIWSMLTIYFRSCGWCRVHGGIRENKVWYLVMPCDAICFFLIDLWGANFSWYFMGRPEWTTIF